MLRQGSQNKNCSSKESVPLLTHSLQGWTTSYQPSVRRTPGWQIIRISFKYYQIFKNEISNSYKYLKYEISKSRPKMSPEVCPCQKLLSRRPTGRNITVAAETPMKKVETVERERGTMKQVLDQLKNLEGGRGVLPKSPNMSLPRGWMDGCALRSMGVTPL